MRRFVTYRGATYPSQCDHMAHMNIMWYVAKFDEANWNIFSEIGITPSYLRQGENGMAGVQQNISYKRELMAGDVIEIRTHIVEIRERSIRFVHEMYNAEIDEICAICELTAVYTDRRSHKSCAFPPDIRRRAELALEGPA